MTAILQFIVKHGYSFLFMALFAHQVGFPLPGPMFLLAGGALAANGKLSFLAVVSLTIIACVAADWIWFEAGRHGGDKVLHFMHRFTRDPEFHDRRAKRVFARYGLALLLISKFVPGLDAVSPPLAGTSRTSRTRFLVFDATGSAIYACAYGGLGYAFSHNLDRAASYVSRAGTLLLGCAFGGICVCYIIPWCVQRHRSVREFRFVRITPTDSIPSTSPSTCQGEILGGQEIASDDSERAVTIRR